MRNFNFSAGPGALPDCVLDEAARAVGELPGTGVSILGLSHRSPAFEAIVGETEENLRALLGLEARHRVLFLQGGGSLQFAMIPWHMLRGRTAEYIVSGYWSRKSVDAARALGSVRVAWDGTAERFTRVPRAGDLSLSPDAAYLHYVSNETVEGVQFHELPGRPGVPRVCDMSSDILSRPHDMSAYDLVYAHAQKNLGPAGVTVVVVDERILADEPPAVPEILQYRAHAEHQSIFNTPPVFAIYVTMLTTRWLLRDIGGLAAMADINARKAATMYELLDAHPDFFAPHAARESRSWMNVVFRLRDRALEAPLVAEAEARGFLGIGGHRTMGGLRVSLYNAVSLEAVLALRAFLLEFRAQNQGRGSTATA